MCSNYQSVVRDYEAEVSDYAAELVRRGVPPWTAVVRATEAVGRRREQEQSDAD